MDLNAQREFERGFTEPERALRYVKELESFDLSTISFEELGQKILDCFRILPFNSAFIEPGSFLYRARVSSTNGPFRRLADITVPPTNLITAYGRANKPFDPVFYSATSAKLAAFEVIQNLRQDSYPGYQVIFVTVGIWRVITRLHVAPIIHSRVLHSVRKDIEKSFQEHQKLLNLGILLNETVSTHNIISNFFADQFTKQLIKTDKDYMISAFFADALKRAKDDIAPQYKDEVFDGINYASVAAQYQGDNQALFLDSFERKLKFDRALSAVCHNFKPGLNDFTLNVIEELDGAENGELVGRK